MPLSDHMGNKKNGQMLFHVTINASSSLENPNLKYIGES